MVVEFNVLSSGDLLNSRSYKAINSIIMKTISGGTAHELPEDLKEALLSRDEALTAWESLTPLARNEWICWVISVKQQETRDEHVERVVSQLMDGDRRPCCWMGCIHRKDKPMSASQKFILSKKAGKSIRGL